MYINNDDLDFLIRLENDLWSVHGWSDDVRTLWKLNEKLIQQRKAGREKTKVAIAEKRKVDKNYARKKNVGGQNDKVK